LGQLFDQSDLELRIASFQVSRRCGACETAADDDNAGLAVAGRPLASWFLACGRAGKRHAGDACRAQMKEMPSAKFRHSSS
jgi:hypothetical protein